MKLKWLSPSGMSISTRLMLWFLAISLIPCSVLTILSNYLSVRSLERSVRSQLLSISSAKNTQLDNFIRERRGDISVISQVPRTVQATVELSQGLAEGSISEADRAQRAKSFL